MATQCLGVVLNANGGCFGGTEGVDAEQEGQRAVVDRQDLGDLAEADQLESVQALGAGLVAVHLGQSCVDRWVGSDSAVDVGLAEEPADAVHHCDYRGVHQPGLPELADVELDVGALDPDEGVEAVALTSGEPATQLERVEGVGTPRVAREEGHRGQLGRRHRERLERQQRVGSGHRGHLGGDCRPARPRSPRTRRGSLTFRR